MTLGKIFFIFFLFLISSNIKAQDAGVLTDSPLFYLKGDTIKAKQGLILQENYYYTTIRTTTATIDSFKVGDNISTFGDNVLVVNSANPTINIPSPIGRTGRLIRLKFYTEVASATLHFTSSAHVDNGWGIQDVEGIPAGGQLILISSGTQWLVLINGTSYF